MGCCGSKDNAERPVRAVQRGQDRQVVQQTLDINEQYSVWFKLVKNSTSGSGIMKTQGYSCLISKGQWYAKRAHFWGSECFYIETRIEGRQEVWDTIKNAIEADQETARAILEAAEIRLIDGSIQAVYDGLGHRYEVPIFCINEPLQFYIDPKSKIEVADLIDKSWELIIRSTRFQGNDIKLNVGQALSISEFKQMIVESQSKAFNFTHVRLFYAGKEMVDESSVGQYRLQDQAIIIANCS